MADALYARRKFMCEKVYSKKEIIEYLQRRAKLLGHTPTITDLNRDKEGPSKKRIEEVFSSYKAAISAAGLKPLPKKWSEYSDKELIKLIKDWSKDHPDAKFTYSLMLQNPDLPNPDVIKKRFGKLGDYLAAAGIAYEKPDSPWRSMHI